MMGWEQNEAPDNFWNTPVDVAASRLGDLMEAYRPQVVVTYDANGFYGHPDHIQAHRITMAAAEATGIPDKVYFTAIPKSALPEFEAMMAEAGVDMPEETTATEGEREGPEFGTDDELIAAVVDCAPFVDAKYDALAAHASQTEDIFFLRLGVSCSIASSAKRPSCGRWTARARRSPRPTSSPACAELSSSIAASPAS